LTDELLANWAPIIAEIQLVPSSGGRFEVTLDGDLIFSKASLRRHAGPGEVANLVEQRLGPAIPRD
jgi:selenoprotein W-related protein